jgi:hypothetical protein
MVKHEVRIEFNSNEKLKSFIQNSYFLHGENGKISSDKNSLIVKDTDTDSYRDLRTMPGATVRLFNFDVIDGSMRFIVHNIDDDSVELKSISIYAITENDKYILY